MATTKKQTELEDEFTMNVEDFENTLSGKRPKTTDELLKESMKVDAEIQTKVNKMREELRKEEKTKIRIAPAYKPYLGSKCQILINGIPIIVPCDGSLVEIPESYAAELYRRMAGIDAMIEMQVKMSNYAGNREQVIGEIKF